MHIFTWGLILITVLSILLALFVDFCSSVSASTLLIRWRKEHLACKKSCTRSPQRFFCGRPLWKLAPNLEWIWKSSPVKQKSTVVVVAVGMMFILLCCQFTNCYNWTNACLPLGQAVLRHYSALVLMHTTEPMLFSVLVCE